MPLQEIGVDVEIVESIALIKLKQRFVNPSSPLECPYLEHRNVAQDLPAKTPIEVTYKFPKEESTIVSKMFATIGGRQVEAMVMEKEKAKQKYDDALAQGKAAALLNESKDLSDLYELDIGNILPGQEAVIEIHLIQPLKIEGGGFDFTLPIAYFPKYSDHDEWRLEQRLKERLD